MTFKRARRLAPALAAAAFAAALAGGSAASASAATQCSGSGITGQGASVEKLAISTVWGPDFNKSTNSFACSGSQGSGGLPVVTYNSTSSGTGLDSWGVSKGAASFGPLNAFIGTEEAPNPTAISEIEANETTIVPTTVQTIPVAQEAIIPIIHLPAGCTATSTAAPGRLVLNNITLEGIFRGSITNWSQITEDGDSVSGSGCVNTTPITKVVRLDSGGTTDVLKKYLDLVNTASFEDEAGATVTWNEIAEGTTNTEWPKVDAVVRPTKTGDSAEVSLVASTASSIGYASLADTRANTAFGSAGGANTATFWPEVQNSGTTTKNPKYADPSTNGESGTVANANCASTKYTNGKGTKFPPASTADSWSQVTTATKEKNFPICAIVYDLGLSSYSAYPGTTEGEAITAENFLQFVLATKAEGGQPLIVGHDYEPLPKSLVKEAVKGAALLAF